MCVFLFVLWMFFYDKIAKKTKKNLIFWFDHGQEELWTYTEVVFIIFDKKTKFLKLL